VIETDGLVAFEPDLDRGLQRCEDALLLMAGGVGDGAAAALDGLPPGIRPYLERMPVEEGARVIEQHEDPGDVFVLESGRLRVDVVTAEGAHLRVRTVLPGVVVGEVAMYTGGERTADVVPSVVLRLSREATERIEAEDPALAAALHRWFATTLARRLHDGMTALDALLD
jgi:SulP family sulfate permease